MFRIFKCRQLRGIQLEALSLLAVIAFFASSLVQGQASIELNGTLSTLDNEKLYKFARKQQVSRRVRKFSGADEHE
jgi:hypothetical protein